MKKYWPIPLVLFCIVGAFLSGGCPQQTAPKADKADKAELEVFATPDSVGPGMRTKTFEVTCPDPKRHEAETALDEAVNAWARNNADKYAVEGIQFVVLHCYTNGSQSRFFKAVTYRLLPVRPFEGPQQPAFPPAPRPAEDNTER